MDGLFIAVILLEDNGRVVSEILHIIQEDLEIQSDSLFQWVQEANIGLF